MFRFLTDESLATVLKPLSVKLALTPSIRLDVDPADLVYDAMSGDHWSIKCDSAKPALFQVLFVPSSGILTPNSVRDTFGSKPFSTI